jgi:MerR family transcriptional regulator/heat shock protein HspR
MQQHSNSGDEPVYVISVAARLAGLPCWVLRVLDQEGIVVPVRTDSNRRLYSDSDVSLLARVRHLTEERGVNIAGVKVILEMEGRLAPSPVLSATIPAAASSNGNNGALVPLLPAAADPAPNPNKGTL